MHTVLKIIHFISGAGFALAFGLIAAIMFWPVTLVLLGLGIWLVFLRGRAP